MAWQVWTEYKAGDPRACGGGHVFSADVLSKQHELAPAVHAPVLKGYATCIDCPTRGGT